MPNLSRSSFSTSASRDRYTFGGGISCVPPENLCDVKPVSQGTGGLKGGGEGGRIYEATTMKGFVYMKKLRRGEKKRRRGRKKDGEGSGKEGKVEEQQQGKSGEHMEERRVLIRLPSLPPTRSNFVSSCSERPLGLPQQCVHGCEEAVHFPQ